MNEADFQRAVIQAARTLGWMVAHFRPALTRSGRWATPVQGDGAGFPDLVLVDVRGAGGVLYRELKADAGRLSPGQRAWLDALAKAGADAAVWRPRDWPVIEATLRREKNV